MQPEEFAEATGLTLDEARAMIAEQKAAEQMQGSVAVGGEVSAVSDEERGLALRARWKMRTGARSAPLVDLHGR